MIPYVDKIENDQYAMTSPSDLAYCIQNEDIDFGVLLIKQGQAIEQTIAERLRQHDVASTITDIVLLSACRCDTPDVKMDDKIRAWLYANNKYFSKYKRTRLDPTAKDKRDERSYLSTAHIIKKLNLEYDLDLLTNKKYLATVDKLITDSVNEAIEALLGQTAKKIRVPYIHQSWVIGKLPMPEEYEYVLLSIAARGGKTTTILEHVQNVANIEDNVVMVIAGKNLAVRASFLNDYKEGDYTYNLHFANLFVEGKVVLDKIADKLDKNSKIILLTDEADRASSTKKSVTSLESIKTKFNVIQQIAMTGTGIYKAEKIFSEISSDQIFKLTLTYTELGEFYINDLVSPIVRRAFFDLQLTMCANKLNIQQSFKDRDRHIEMAKIVFNATTSNKLGDYSKAVMVFINVQNNEHLISFAKIYAKQYGKLQEQLVLVNGTATNLNAERVTNNKLDDMSKRDSTKDKQLIIFSNKLADRSYSIAEIHRVILLQDGNLTNTGSQKLSRALTYMKGKVTASLIRISFSDLTLSADIFLVENPDIDSASKTKRTEIAEDFWGSKVNSFASYKLVDGFDGAWKSQYNGECIAKFLDRVMKIDGSIKSMALRTINDFDAMDIDAVPVSTQSNTKSMGKDSDKKTGKKSKGDIDVGDIGISQQQLILEAYFKIILCLPVIADQVLGIDNLNDLINIDSDVWEKYIPTSQSALIANLEIEEVQHNAEMAFRIYDKKEYESHINDVYNLYQ